ncbi:MAG: amino acid ABC transporter permease [Burkholderiaceae bacterium]|nr:amino acid ABC transporter permease [Burkholderiaceae bacterium]MCD8517786.1 amino acid ABC transporter permease [Burkholderiaceae bacterium]MCD8538006.1 amino acid ABC transporter permease [Burkholderiaceae bacterium]MCD8564203.1 amino acid ABC transporter permease [Burkholderiaceae bacterium]
MTKIVAKPPHPSLRALWHRGLGHTRAARVINLIVLILAIWLAGKVTVWALLDAVAPWQDAALCKQADGACWPFLTEKMPLILFGTFPYDERWRPLMVSVSLIVMSSATLFQWCSWRWQAVGWLFSLVLFAVLMGGGHFELRAVATAQWNGLPVLLFLGTVSLAAALPVGLALALGRHAHNPWLHWPCKVFIETLRGIPMVAVLFFGVFVLPLLLGGFKLSAIYAALIVLVFFHGAYVAEDLRSGLQSIARGQWEASASIGLTHWKTLRLVILPQAIKSATPALTNTAIGGFKDTSLIVLVGLHDMLSTAKMAFSDVNWQAQALEAYVFVGVVFFVLNGVIAIAGRRLERVL